MKTYLKSFVKQLKNYSESLDKISILIEKPWAMIDEELEMQKLIFRKNKELLMSKNGKVTIGKWDYLTEAKSLLIDRGTDKILFNEGYIDQYVMILKLDGTVDAFFALANENLLPDLNVYEYLRKLKYNKLKITTRELKDGRILEIQRSTFIDDNDNTVYTGNKVFVDSDEISDGIYELKSDCIKYVIEQNKIQSILYKTKYRSKDGLDLVVDQRARNSTTPGDPVFVNGQEAPNGKYQIGFLNSIKVKDGRVV